MAILFWMILIWAESVIGESNPNIRPKVLVPPGDESALLLPIKREDKCLLWHLRLPDTVSPRTRDRAGQVAYKLSDCRSFMD